MTPLQRLQNDIRNPPADWIPRTATRPSFEAWAVGRTPRGDNTLEYEYAITYWRLPTNRGDFFTRYGVAIASLGVGAAVSAAASAVQGFAPLGSAAEVSPIYGAASEGGTMSLLGDVFSTVSQGVDLFKQIQSVRAPTTQMATLAPIAMGAMPQVARALPALGAAAGVAVRGAGAIMRSANTYCRRNPAWCAQIGGTTAIAAMIQSGQLPTVRRRRRKGISGRDLGAYRRVHNLLAGFCSPKAKIRKAC